MLTLTSPVPTPWHRLPAGAKLAGLFLFTMLLFAVDTPWALVPVAVAVAALYLPGGKVFVRHGLRLLRPLLPFVAVVAIWHIATGKAEYGALICLRLLSGIGLANLVTMTTRLSDIVAVIERLAAPLARFGIRPRLLGLAVALVIRFIPVTAERMARLTEAWRARSARRAGWRIALPATLGALDDAEHVAEALRARGGAG
jgi:biotin transport system permease protein